MKQSAMDIDLTLKELGIYESYCECLQECIKLNDRRFGLDNPLSKRNKEELRKFMKRHKIIAGFVDSLPDPEIRKIIDWKYIHRLHWSKVNMKVYGYSDYSYSRIRLRRYFKKHAEIVTELEEALSGV